MADKPASERTEEATPERIRKAREEGQIPQSQEVPTAMMVVALLMVLLAVWPSLYAWLTEQVRGGLEFSYRGSLGAEGFRELLETKAWDTFLVILPFMAAGAAVSVAASLLVGGWSLSTKALKLDLSRVNPVKGMKNLFSTKNVIKLLFSLVKLAVIGGLCWSYMQGRWTDMINLQGVSVPVLVMNVGNLVYGLLLRICIALVAIALVDFLYQKWHYKKDLRMTRQEVRDEMKQYEINPQIKGRIRSTQMEMARKRMLSEVPTADVVVTNPTHVAVALRYDASQMNAPIVVAKGPDHLCQQIKSIARKHDVPIIERPPLARSLFAACEVGEPIPETLFVAVAEILAMIYRLRKQRQQTSLATEPHV